MAENRQTILQEEAKKALMSGFQIYDVQVHHGKKGSKVVVYLDKLTDPTGSPTIEECEEFSRRFRQRMANREQEGILENDFALDVSSPGAERELRSDDEIRRFSDRPMSVLYEAENGRNRRSVFMLEKLEPARIHWRPAVLKRRDVKAGKKSGKAVIDRKNRRKINLYLDF